MKKLEGALCTRQRVVEKNKKAEKKKKTSLLFFNVLTQKVPCAEKAVLVGKT